MTSALTSTITHSSHTYKNATEASMVGKIGRLSKPKNNQGKEGQLRDVRPNDNNSSA